MSTSQKRIDSSRLNGSRSKGPTTVAGKLISRKNAETHGFRSRRFLIPGEQDAEVEERIDEMLSSMGPRTEGERTLLLSAVQCSVIFERSLAAQAARISANIDDADHRLEVEAKGLLKRLFHSRQGPIETYGSEQYLSGGERVSYSPIPDDPEDPETLVSSLERTVPGCRLMLAEWAELRALLEPPGRWQAVHRFRAIRLLGRNPLAAIWDRRVLEIHFRAWTTNPARDEAWLELRGELTRVEYKRYRRALDRQYADLLDSGDDEKERQVLRSIVDRAVEQLQAKLAVAEERALAEADRKVACLSFDDSHTGELLRRYSTSSQRAMVKSLEAFAKLRRKTKDEDGEPRREAREFRDPSGPGPWDEIYDTPNEGYVAEMERRARMAAREPYGQPNDAWAKSETPNPKSETLNPKSEFGEQATEGCLDLQSHDSQPATENDPGLLHPTSTIAALVTIDPNHTIAPGHAEPVDSMESVKTEFERGEFEVAGIPTDTKNDEVAEFPNEPSDREVAGIPTEVKNHEVAEFPNEPSEGEVAPSQGQGGDRNAAATEADPVRQVTIGRELILSVVFLLAGSSLLAAGLRPERGRAASASAPSPGLRPTSPLPSPPTSCGDLSQEERWGEVKKEFVAVPDSGAASATRRPRPSGERVGVRGRGQKDPRQRAGPRSGPAGFRRRPLTRPSADLSPEGRGGKSKRRRSAQRCDVRPSSAFGAPPHPAFGRPLPCPHPPHPVGTSLKGRGGASWKKQTPPYRAAVRRPPPVGLAPGGRARPPWRLVTRSIDRILVSEPLKLLYNAPHSREPHCRSHLMTSMADPAPHTWSDQSDVDRDTIGPSLRDAPLE